MQGLRELFAQSGATDVETLIQSGNVIFTASEARAPKIIEEAVSRLKHHYGFAAPMVLRDARTWAALIDGNPFVRSGANPDTLHALCLSEKPSAAAVLSLDPNRSPKDEFRICGRDVYLRLSSGVARSKLTNAWFDSKLGVVSTLRNWRTVMKLGEIIAARSRLP
jgi:uncharacterized protein (DUF1697 family)